MSRLRSLVPLWNKQGAFEGTPWGACCASKECASHVCKGIWIFAVLLLFISTLFSLALWFKLAQGPVLMRVVWWYYLVQAVGRWGWGGSPPLCNCQLANQPLMETRRLIVLRCWSFWCEPQCVALLWGRIHTLDTLIKDWINVAADRID